MGKISKTGCLLLVILLGISLVMLLFTVGAQIKTLTVPDQYPTIQEAIKNANAGDTIFVKKGTYNLPADFAIDKPLSLIGEGAQNTIISGNGHNYRANAGNLVSFQIGAPNVLIKGFTIKDCNVAILVENWANQQQPTNCKILDNTFTDNNQAIEITRGQNFEISGNTFIENDGGCIGISASGIASTGIIQNNIITKNGQAISIYSNNVIVQNNIIQYNREGLNLQWTGQYTIHDNLITNNSIFGLNFGRGVTNTIVYKNEIDNNGIGVNLENFGVSGDAYIGYGNVVYGNNFVDNKKNAFAETAYPYRGSNEINGTDIVSWDNGNEGNYWGDYKGNGEYTIDQNNTDHHPLTKQVNISIIIPSAVNELLLPIVLGVGIFLAISICLLLFRLHRKTANLKE
jgi:parallel beta-helix repeat protein